MRANIKRLAWLFSVPVLVSTSSSWGSAHGRPTADRGAYFDQVGPRERLSEIAELVEESGAVHHTGLDRWRSLLEGQRSAIEAAETHAQFAAAVNKVLKSTGVSHFKYLTDRDWAYWHLRSAFGGNTPERQAEHAGIFAERIGGRWFVRGLLEGSEAASKDMRIGDELLTVDGRPFSPIASFRGKAGKPTHIRLRRRPGLIYYVILTPVRDSLYEAMQKAVHESIKIIEIDGFRVAYMHGWTLLGPGTEYDELSGLQDAVEGLLLDYRDGFGGTWNVALRFLLGPKSGPDQMRRNPRWHKPVVILIDDGARSAKEIVVDAVQRAGRAPLVGEPTPGAVTQVGAVRRLGADGLLMLPGRSFSLEGQPTEPDYLVERDIRYCAGTDRQLQRAKEVLSRLIREASERKGRALSP
jgi:carboxyl-terminal processing protease